MHDPRETRRDNAFSSRLQIVNWNRNPILIKEIRLLTPSEITLSSVRVEDHDAGRRNVLQQEYIRGRMFVPGWVDRSKIPIVAEFDLTFSTNNPSLTAFAENNLVRLSVKLRIDITIAPSGIVLKASSWSDRMLWWSRVRQIREPPSDARNGRHDLSEKYPPSPPFDWPARTGVLRAANRPTACLRSSASPVIPDPSAAPMITSKQEEDLQ